MGLFTKDIKTIDDLFLHGMRDIYYAEHQIVKSLPKMIEKATDKDLSAGLLDHLRETENQLHRLDIAFERLWAASKGNELSRYRRPHQGSGRACWGGRG